MSADRGNVYASGKNALAECPRCGLPIYYTQLRRDGQTKNFVCADCWDPKHPQEKVPRDIYDATALRHPRKDRDVNNENFYAPDAGCTGTGTMGSVEGVIT